MHPCDNCGKQISDNKKFCNEDCVREYYEQKSKSDSYIMELDYLGNDIKGKRVELELARGRNIKGTVVGFDTRYGKIAIEHFNNNKKVVTLVKLSYIVSFHIYT